MSPIEKLYFLFKDTFYSNLILSFDSEIAFWTIYEFDGLSQKVVMVGLAAIIFAMLANYFFGVVLHNMFIKGSNGDRLVKYNSLSDMWQRWHMTLFCLCLVPNAYKVLLVLCGFLKFNFPKTIGVVGFFKAVMIILSGVYHIAL